MYGEDRVITYLRDNVSRRNTVSRNQRIIENLFSDPSVTDDQRKDIVEFVRMNPHLFTPYTFDDDIVDPRQRKRTDPCAGQGSLRC